MTVQLVWAALFLLFGLGARRVLRSNDVDWDEPDMRRWRDSRRWGL